MSLLILSSRRGEYINSLATFAALVNHIHHQHRYHALQELQLFSIQEHNSPLSQDSSIDPQS
jgi:hypothetical protein